MTISDSSMLSILGNAIGSMTRNISSVLDLDGKSETKMHKSGLTKLKAKNLKHVISSIPGVDAAWTTDHKVWEEELSKTSDLQGISEKGFFHESTSLSFKEEGIEICCRLNDSVEIAIFIPGGPSRAIVPELRNISVARQRFASLKLNEISVEAITNMLPEDSKKFVESLKLIAENIVGIEGKGRKTISKILQGNETTKRAISRNISTACMIIFHHITSTIMNSYGTMPLEMSLANIKRHCESGVFKIQQDKTKEIMEKEIAAGRMMSNGRMTFMDPNTGYASAMDTMDQSFFLNDMDIQQQQPQIYPESLDRQGVDWVENISRIPYSTLRRVQGLS